MDTKKINIISKLEKIFGHEYDDRKVPSPIRDRFKHKAGISGTPVTPKWRSPLEL